MIAPSQGIHLVFDSSFLQGESAVMVPHTSDGRVLFAIPWHGHTLVGTTDTPIATATLEPVAMEQEIEFILATAGQYLAKAPTRDDVLSVFAGIRPLVRATGVPRRSIGGACHAITSSTSIAPAWSPSAVENGRRIATWPRIASIRRPRSRSCRKSHVSRTTCASTASTKAAKQFGSLAVYGSDADEIRKLIEADARLGEPLHAALPYIKAEVVWAARHEMARTVEDVLARRTRALFLNARAALAMAPAVADLMASELGWDEATRSKQLAAFRDVASNYVLR